jgi:ubiquinone/menaquinone biosynthesis C-methylase UbiE
LKHSEALLLLESVNIKRGETWADLGAGTGTFSRALSELVGANGTVHAVDKDKHALSQLALNSASVILHYQDFTQSLELNNLDGILMANALHFIRRQKKVLREISDYLKENGRLVILEYDISRANPWVPFPVPFDNLKDLAARAGLSEPVKVARKDSRYHREMYVAVINKL